MPPRALALREGKAPVRDRLLTMLFLAALLHGLIILGLTFNSATGGKDIAPGLKVLLVSDEAGTKVGAPRVAEASVLGTVLEQGRDHKIRVFKYKKRKHYRRTRGHRQSFTALRIDAIQA